MFPMLPVVGTCVLECARRRRASLLTFDDRLAKRAAEVGVRLATA
jgi:rRNA-processing protein FCF1